MNRLFGRFVFASILFLSTMAVAAETASYEYIELNKNPSSLKVEQRRHSGVNNEAIKKAELLQRKFGVIAKPTPLYSNVSINAFAKKLLGHDIVIYMKDETVNPTGSFKDRMPIKFYRKISEKVGQAKEKAPVATVELKAIAVSTGNHGRAVAYAANVANKYIVKESLQDTFHVYSEITMSSDALPHKKKAIAELGASIRDHENGKPIPSYDVAENVVVKESKSDPEHTLLLLHADKDAITGYAVIAEEIIQQMRGEGVDLSKMKPGEAMLLVPLGSGGLLSGTEEVSVDYPNVYSVGVTAAPADLTYRSLKSGKLVRSVNPYKGKLIVDGVMATPEEFSLRRIEEVAKEVVLVQQKDAVYATALLRKNGINIEPTSGLPLAALLLGVNQDYKHVRYAVVVLTGRNISDEMEREISRLAREDSQVLFEYFKKRRSAIEGG